MKKKVYILIALIIVMVTALGIKGLLPYIKPIKSNYTLSIGEKNKREELILSFIENKLISSNYGIKTNYLNHKSEGDITKGEGVLSESQGLMLLYYLSRDDKNAFDNILSYIKENMLLENNLISWRVEEGASSKVSAAIDDLRIVKALLLASEKWNDRSYRNLAVDISRGIKEELVENNLISDFNDGYSKSRNTTLCYIDLYALRLLSEIDGDYKVLYEEGKDLIAKGYISDEVPLYKKVYNWDRKTFDDEEGDMLLSSIILLSLAEDGEDTTISREWIKKEMKKENKLYSLYSKDSGKALNNIESTSIYGNLLQVAAITEDRELYDYCYKRILEFQVIKEDSEIYGAFGEENEKQVHSFDNLNGLIGISRKRP